MNLKSTKLNGIFFIGLGFLGFLLPSSPATSVPSDITNPTATAVSSKGNAKLVKAISHSRSRGRRPNQQYDDEFPPEGFGPPSSSSGSGYGGGSSGYGGGSGTGGSPAPGGGMGNSPSPNFGGNSSSGGHAYPSLPSTPGGGPGGPGFPGDKGEPSGSTSTILTSEKKDKFARSGIEDITNENFPEVIESFDFPDAKIEDVIKAISELTGRNFILDQGISGKITILAPSKITVAEAYKAFLSALAFNDLAIVPGDGFYKIRKSAKAKQDNIDIFPGNYYPNTDQMITKIIHLKYLLAKDITSTLKIIAGSNAGVTPYDPTNSLIISDYGSSVDRLMKIINQLDVPGFEEQPEVIPVKYAKATDLAELINKIVNKDTRSSSTGALGSFTAGVPRPWGSSSSSGGRGNSGGGAAYYMVIPDARTNSLIVVGNKEGITKLKSLLKQLDYRIRTDDESGSLHVYHVKNGEAAKIAETLKGITKDAGPKGGSGSSGSSPAFGISPFSGVQAPQEIFAGNVVINADAASNALVIVANKQDYEMILSILRKLDRAQDQVFVEAIIMEMNASDAFTWESGTFTFKDKSAYGKGGFNGLSSGTMNSLAAGATNPLAMPGGAILGFAGGNDVTVPSPTDPTKSFTVPNLLSLVNLLKNVNNANILSQPQIVAMNAQEANIRVQDDIPASNNATVNATGQQSSNIQYKEAGLDLKLTPYISPASSSIRMKVVAKVSQPTASAAPKALQDQALQLAKREIDTNVVIPDGDTAVLGGLMREEDQISVSKVPLLGDIPILGWLFSSRSTAKRKTNLLVFLTPRIIRSPKDHKLLLDRKTDQRLDYIRKTGGEDPFGGVIDDITKKKLSSASSVIPPEGRPKEGAESSSSSSPPSSTQDSSDSDKERPESSESPTAPEGEDPPPPSSSSGSGSGFDSSSGSPGSIKDYGQETP